MGKDYSDSNEEKRRAQGVEDGAPAYQANPSLYLVTDQEDQTLQEVLLQTVYFTRRCAAGSG